MKWHAIADGTHERHISNALCGVQPSGNATLTESPESDLGPYAEPIGGVSASPASPCAACMLAVSGLPVVAAAALPTPSAVVLGEYEQDIVNDLATAARRVYVEQVCAEGFLLALAANGLEATADRLRPYAEALNLAHKRAELMARALGWTGSNRIAVLNPDHKCNDRCTKAKSKKCACACGGIRHGALRGFSPAQTPTPPPAANAASPAIGAAAERPRTGKIDELLFVIRDQAVAAMEGERTGVLLPILPKRLDDEAKRLRAFGERRPDLEAMEVHAVHVRAGVITAVVQTLRGDLAALTIEETPAFVGVAA